MANKERGEIEVAVCGKSYTMRPTFESMCELEDTLGKGSIKLAEELFTGTATTRDMAMTIYYGIKGSGAEPPAVSDIGASVLKMGVSAYIEKLTSYYLLALGGPEEDGAKEQPESA